MRPNRDVRKVLITGATGSGGSYLSEYIVNNHPDVDVHGISRWHSTTTSDNLSGVSQDVELHEADLMDFGSIMTVLQKVKPDAVFHLAAHANVRTSFMTPNSVLANNILGTSNLLEAIRLIGIDPVIQICSTSEVYGQVDPMYIPIREDTPMLPASPYAVSKVAQDLLGRSYFVSYGMHVVRTRMFAYLNPRRSDLFASAFAKQVAWIEQGLQEELRHGNLDSIRTIIDVRDAMSAYWLALQCCRPGEAYNIGGLTSVSVKDFLELLVSLATVPIPTKLDSNLLRPADVTLQIPCVDKFVEETGWTPEYSFQESVGHLLSYWREEAKFAAQRIADK